MSRLRVDNSGCLTHRFHIKSAPDTLSPFLSGNFLYDRTQKAADTHLIYIQYKLSLSFASLIFVYSPSH